MSDLAGGFKAGSVGRGWWKPRAVLVVGVGVPLGVVASAAPAAADDGLDFTPGAELAFESKFASGAGVFGDLGDPSDLRAPSMEDFGEGFANVTEEPPVASEGTSGPSHGFELKEETRNGSTMKSWARKPVYGGMVETKHIETRDSGQSVQPKKTETTSRYTGQDSLWPDRTTTRKVTSRYGDVSLDSDKEIRGPALIVRARRNAPDIIRGGDDSFERLAILGGLPSSRTASIEDYSRTPKEETGGLEAFNVEVSSGPAGPEIEVGFFSGANGEYEGQDLIWDGETAQTRPRWSPSGFLKEPTDLVEDPAGFDRLGDVPVELFSGVEGTAVLRVGNTVAADGPVGYNVAAAGPLGSATFTRNPDGSSEVAYAGTNGEALRSLFDGKKYMVSKSDQVGSDEYVVR